MSKPLIRWYRSDSGYVDSHCANWRIEPEYWGCTSPQGYRLVGYSTLRGRYDTQREAKDAAQIASNKEWSSLAERISSAEP
jgi:hypothetical protein